MHALTSTPNWKSLGSDGFTADFYKVFCIDGKDLVINSLNAKLETSEISINLLPKKDKDQVLLTNWRPIYLLNQDYKHATKCITTRIAQCIRSLIYQYQTRFLKSKYIEEKINRILSSIDETDEQDIPAIITCIDFENAFDSLEWSFICQLWKSLILGQQSNSGSKPSTTTQHVSS